MKKLTFDEVQELYTAVEFYIWAQEHQLTDYFKNEYIKKDLTTKKELLKILRIEAEAVRTPDDLYCFQRMIFEEVCEYDISNEISIEKNVTLNCDDDIIKASVNDIFCVSEAEIEKEQNEAAEWYDNGIFK